MPRTRVSRSKAGSSLQMRDASNVVDSGANGIADTRAEGHADPMSRDAAEDATGSHERRDRRGARDKRSEPTRNA